MGKMPVLLRARRRKRSTKSDHIIPMKSLLRLSAAILTACSLASCGTNVTMLGPARPAISPAAVRIYQVPPRHFEQIAIINSSAGTTWIFPNRDSLDEAFADLRNEAAALGANGVLLQEVYDQPVGGLSVGGGGFGYGHHGFYGGAGSVGGPLINGRVQAIELFVRRLWRLQVATASVRFF